MRDELMRSVEAALRLEKRIARQQEFIQVLESAGHTKAVEDARALLSAMWASQHSHVACQNRISASLARFEEASGCAVSGTREMSGG
ncbi:isochorismate hydrolase [Rhodoblastus acidophilus]|uniref:hypothetical protein n=1 Tax=Rhodoblastus acidophilus TaxID=1074 RepID=UPI002224E546|nr:hypothetical protein [Rhodoblastus acidophilus]MCW2286763.1 isochorismate hydrolase [Rhodoblastus acidophilus]MCW2335589.1 isochorismate hydrolase [Rhodoblastus acidophilus]